MEDRHRLHHHATTRSAPGSPSRRERDTDTIDPFTIISASSSPQHPPHHHHRSDDLYSLIDPPLLHSPSEILIKSKRGPSYYAYSPSQMANRERCYEIITTTTHDDIFNDRESQDRQSEVENEAFWLGLSEDEIMKRKQSNTTIPSNCSSTTTSNTSPRLSTSPSSFSALPAIQDKRLYTTSDNDSNDDDQEEEEEDPIDGIGSSSIGLIDLDELSDDEQVSNNELDDLGPLAKYARENRRKRKMEEMLSSQ